MRLSSVTASVDASPGRVLILLCASKRDSSFFSPRTQEGNDSRRLLLASNSLRFLSAARLAGRLERRLP